MNQPAVRANLIRRACVGTIPDDWKIVSVAEIMDRKPNAIVGGPFGSDLVSTDYVPAGIPVIRGANMLASNVSGDFVFISEEKGKSLSANMAGPGDVVFTQRGTLGQVAIVPDGPFEKYLISQSQMKLSANSDVIHKPYLLHYFASFAGQKQILDSAIQTGVPHTNLSILRNYAIPLPPTAEQEAIAEALSDADALIEGLERLIAKKRLIKQGAMQDLLTAKRRLPGFTGGWSSKKFGEIARIRNQKIQTFGDSRAEKCIELEQVESETGRLSHWSSAADRTTSKYLFQPGDVLFGRLRPYLRKYFLARTEGVCSTEIWPLCSIGVASNFLYHIVQSEPFVVAACESYGTHMPRADWGKLLTFELNIPDDIEEQDAIGSVLLDMDAEIQAFETRLEKARQVKEGMMQNLLTGRIRLV